MVWQPGLTGIVGEAEYPPPSICHWVVKPLIDGNDGSIKPELQVLDGAVSAGTVGNTIAFKVVSAQGLIVPARVVPQSVFNLYLALMVQQPGTLVTNAFIFARFSL